jgi:hypothetical protein
VKESRKHYKYVKEFKEPLNASFEIDGKVFVTDRATLDLLNHKRDKGSLRVAQWLFAVNLATGRIKRSERVPAVRAD